MMQVALCLFHRNENEYLPEWLDHHRALGIDHFYVYDNGSDHLPPGNRDVTVIDFSADQAIGKQMRAYHQCHRAYGRWHEWIGFLDTDEFVVGDIICLLKRMRYAWCGCVSQVLLSTRLYGSNGLETRSDRQFGSYGQFWVVNDHVKSFIRARWPLRKCPSTPHYFDTYGVSITASGKRCSGAISPHVDHPVVIDHYYTRSRAEWAAKCDRGRGDGVGRRTIAEFDAFNERVAAFRSSLIQPAVAAVA